MLQWFCRTPSLRHLRHLSVEAQPASRPRGRPRKTPVPAARQTNLEFIPDSSRTTETESQQDTRLSEKAAPSIESSKTNLTNITDTATLHVSMLHDETKHHNLNSFVDHAARTGANINSTVYRGTLFEYQTAETLRSYGFDLCRIGRSNDLGVDLIGTWKLPTQPSELHVLVQCKVTQPSPAMIRELEGAYVGAPAGWRSQDTMAFLVSSKPATKGVRDALQRSKLPMGVAQITDEGMLSQFLWNHVAAEARLVGLGTTVSYGRKPAQGSSGNDAPALALTWLGGIWKRP